MTHETFWSTLDPGEREAMQEVGRKPQHPFQPGDQVFRQHDDRADRAALIISGQCRVLWQGAAARTTYLATRRDGDLIGEMALLDGGRNATVMALTNTYVRWYAREVFEELLARHPGIMRKLLTSMSIRLKESDRQQIALTTAPPRVRVPRLLLRLAEAEGAPTDQGLLIREVSQRDIGDWTGMGRDAAGRGIARLRAERLIDTLRSRRRILVTDLDGLRRHAAVPAQE